MDFDSLAFQLESKLFLTVTHLSQNLHSSVYNIYCLVMMLSLIHNTDTDIEAWLVFHIFFQGLLQQPCEMKGQSNIYFTNIERISALPKVK